MSSKPKRDAAAKRVDAALDPKKRRVPPAEKRCVRIKKDGEQCLGWKAKGTPLCSKHGSRAPHIAAAGKRRQQQAQAEADCRRLSVPIEKDAGEALMDELYRTLGWVNTYELFVQDLTLELDSAWGAIYGGKDGYDTGERKPHVVIELLDRERKHLKDVTVAILKAGIDERRVRLAEAEAKRFAQVVAAICKDFDIDLTVQENRDKIRLRLIEGGRVDDQEQAA